MHGLMVRELRLKGDQSSYYTLLDQKEKELISLNIKYKYYAVENENFHKKLAEHEKEIASLRELLKKYQVIGG